LILYPACTASEKYNKAPADSGANSRGTPIFIPEDKAAGHFPLLCMNFHRAYASFLSIVRRKMAAYLLLTDSYP